MTALAIAGAFNHRIPTKRKSQAKSEIKEILINPLISIDVYKRYVTFTCDVTSCEVFLPVGRAFRARPAGPKITLRSPRLWVYMCVSTYHVRNNYVTYIVAM